MKRGPYVGDSYTTKWRKQKNGQKRKIQGPSEPESSAVSSRNSQDPFEDAPPFDLSPTSSAEGSDSVIQDFPGSVRGRTHETSSMCAADHLDLHSNTHCNDHEADSTTPQNEQMSQCESTVTLALEETNAPITAEVVNSTSLEPVNTNAYTLEAEAGDFPDSYFDEVQLSDIAEALSGTSIHLSGSTSSIASTESNQHNSSSDSDTDSIFCGSFEAHFLEEDPLAVHEDQGEAGDDDTDDPGNPDDNSDNEDESEEESGEESDGELADFTSEELHARPVLVNNCTKGHLILTHLAASSRHNKTFECLLDDFRNMNLLLGKNWLPESKPKLFSVISLNKGAAKYYAYCGQKECGRYIGRRDRLPADVRCRSCHHTVPVSKAHFFVMLNIRKQLQAFLRIPGMWEKLQYRHNRVKVSATAIEDVYDSFKYKEMRNPGGPLESEYNFSYVLNTDGVKPFKNGKLKIWPVFVRINELPPEMRQRFCFLVCLYADMHDPNFQSFLKPLVRELNRLFSVGISWRPDGINEVVSHFVPFCCGVDAIARYGILQMNSVTGFFGCTYCLQEGIRLANCSRFSFLDEEGNYLIVEDRNHDGMVQDMLASQDGNEVRGHKGLSQLLLLRHFDLRLGQAHDDLHQDHEGCAKDITEVLLQDAPRVGEGHVHFIDIIREVDRRMLSIKTPSIIARKPMSLSKRGSYKGSAWRNWLFYYSVPCLSGLIDAGYLRILADLSHGCYLLSQNVIEEADINEAERNLKSAAQRFQVRFGLERVKYNLHATTRHKVKSIRTLGPPWHYSTYNFESLNSKLAQRITSPKGAMQQVVTRCFLNLTVTSALYDETLPNCVQNRLKEITSRLKLKRLVRIGAHSYAVGTAVRRRPTFQENEILNRENVHAPIVLEYPSVLIGKTRFMSIHHQSDSKSDDTFIYTTEDTFCTIERVFVHTNENGEEHCGVIVREHDVARHLEVASHIAVLRGDDADLMHYIDISRVKCPAIKYNIDGLLYAVPVASTFEID